MVSHSLEVLSRLDPQVPAALARRAERWRDTDVPVEALASASVMLLRDDEPGLEAYLLQRHARMPFAASMVVFPGGRVDPADHDGAVGDVWRACAVRETAEETGVRLETADLSAWAHWTTPECEPRRFETRFFVAPMPSDQTARDISGETDGAEWSTPARALSAERRGELALMPPTLSILLELAELSTVAEVVDRATGRIVEPVLPVLLRRGTSWSFRYPGSDAGLDAR